MLMWSIPCFVFNAVNTLMFSENSICTLFKFGKKLYFFEWMLSIPTACHCIRNWMLRIVFFHFSAKVQCGCACFALSLFVCAQSPINLCLIKPKHVLYQWNLFSIELYLSTSIPFACHCIRNWMLRIAFLHCAVTGQCATVLLSVCFCCLCSESN